MLGTYSGDTFADDSAIIDTAEAVMPAFIDKDGNTLYAVDSEFGFYVTDFIGAAEYLIRNSDMAGFSPSMYMPSIVPS